MTGRARGRSRGRGRAAQDASQRPGGAQGGPPPQAAAPQQGGGGRGRTRGQPAPQQVAPQQRPAAQTAVPPTARMAQMSVKDQKPATEERQPRRRRLDPAPDVLVTRPEGRTKEGTGGTPVNIVSNFFKVIKMPNFKGLYQYNVSFDPEINSSKLKNALLYQMADVLGQTKCFDGMTLFLPKRLPDQITTRSVTTHQGNAIVIKIMFTNVIPEISPQVLQMINIIFRRQLRCIKMELIGRNYFNSSRKIEVKAHKMEVWPGFSTSILQYEKDVMLCADVQHKVVRQQSVLSMMYELHQKTREKNRFYELAAKKLIGETVITRYNKKNYKIDDIEWNKNPNSTFDKNGTQITFKEYFEKTYDAKVGDDQQPLLVSLPKAKNRKSGIVGPILLLPEFCLISGLSDEIRSNFSIMKDLAQHTRINPAERAKNLEQFVQDLQTNEESKKELEQWNLKFESKLLQMTGRAYGSEKMFQREDQFSYKIQDADWSRETRGKKLIHTVNMTDWLLVYYERDEPIATDFKQTLVKVCGPMGMNVAEPQLCRLKDDTARSYFRALSEQIRPTTQIVVCIVPNNRKDRYDSIKKLCCVEKPIPSQVIVSRTLSKKQMLMSVCTKIGIQLNCKLGGEIWAVDIPISKNPKDPPSLMVVGFDVYHDSASKGKSIGGFIASTNRHLTKYYSRITQQQSHQEIADQLRVCMTGALKKFNELNGTMPSRIIVYRDGVGDGQLRQVFDHELPQFKAAFNAISQGYDPKFTMIVVKKRISTRLFLSERGMKTNPLPGTVVDTVVTRPEWYDFFLVSQSVRQGTVSPTHYNIIADTSGWKPDIFQRLTYKLCHLYYNWPGTIRVPAPCQYAHKLAFLVGQSIHAEPDVQLADRLYYL